VTTRYDPTQRRAADRLQQRNPNWAIIWGTWSRQYWAYPRFHTAPGTLVHAADPATLLAHMRQAELTASPTPHPGHPPPAARPPPPRPPGNPG
jgi:hypothetical protein